MANMTFKTNLLPNSNLEYNLGSTNKKWNIYGRLSTTSKDIEDEDKLIITDGNDYYSTNITFDGATETQYLTQKGTFASAPVESVAGMDGNVSLYTLAVGDKSYNGSENIVVTMADLGISSAMRFLGITNTAITEGSTTTPINIVSGGSLGEVTPSNGDVILTSTDQIEYIYTGSEWKELGLASSYALRHHSHGNIITDGTITSDTTIASGNKLVITDASNKVARSNISFGTSTTKALSNAGTWIDVNNYTLPTASASVKGGIKVGSGLTISNEVLSANVTGIKGNAETSYRTGNVNLTAANIGAAASTHNHDSTYVNTTGDTMTGNLVIKTNNNPSLRLLNTEMDTHAASLTAAEYNSIYFMDKNSENNLSSYIQCQQATNGNVILSMASRRRNAANDGNVTNAINLTTARDGTLSVSVSTPAGWRTAIGAAASDHNHNSSYVNVTGDTMTGQLYINYAQDVGLNQNGSLIIGTKSGTNVAIDNDEIMARNNSAASPLYLNWEGGSVNIGAGGLTAKSTITANGGYLKSTLNGNTVTIGSSNTNYCHISNSAAIPFWFNQTIYMEKGKTIGAAGTAYRPFQLYLGRNTTTQSNAINSGNPLIEFSNSDRSQYGQLVYTDFDAIRAPDGLTWVGNQANSWFQAPRVFGAVWNDYAEYRETKEDIEPGRCIVETGNGDLILSTERLQEGCEVVSDTFGFAIGETKTCKTPTACAGRVLVYLYEDNTLAKPGRPVCSGPNGTVSLMTNEEAREYPWCIIGTVSEIPDYDEWEYGSADEHGIKNKLKVDGRIWIRIR